MITLSFVIPVYNEEKRIKKTLEALAELRLPRGLKLEEIIFVDDGSTDQTARLLFEHARRIKIISCAKNQGKGFAVKTGMLSTTSDYTLFFDADMATPLSEIAKFMPSMKRGVDVIVGTRKNGESTVIKHQPLVRELLGHTFTVLTKTLLGLSVTDFTCGFKAFSKRARTAIFPQIIINRWAFDAEIMVIAKKYDLSLVEKSVAWSDKKGSKVRVLEAIPQTLFDLLRIYLVQKIELPKLFANLSLLRYGKNIPSV